MTLNDNKFPYIIPPTGAINTGDGSWYPHVLLSGVQVSNYNDGISSDGIVFAGDSGIEILIYVYIDPIPSNGIVFGGECSEKIPNFYRDGSTFKGIVFGSIGTEIYPLDIREGVSSGGIVFGGTIWEQWRASNNSVAVKGGAYRINGIIYVLTNVLSYSGLGLIAAIVDCGIPPASPGLYRYDLLSVDSSGIITVTHGAEAFIPVMPALPANQVKLDHVLRYYEQGVIAQSDIGRKYITSILATLGISADDDSLAWGQMVSNITITCYDQYNQIYRGGAIINGKIISGNGTLAPGSKSVGASGIVTFVYTRGGSDPGDESPYIQFTSHPGASSGVYISLYDIDGAMMISA